MLLQLPKIALETDQGRIEIILFEFACHNAAASMISLTDRGFYNGLSFFSEAPEMRLHFGRNSDAEGPGYHIHPEEGKRQSFDSAGWVGLGSDDTDNGGDFFISLEALPHLDGVKPLVGQVVDGMDVMLRLQSGSTIRRAILVNCNASDYEVEADHTREETVKLSRK